MFVHILVIHFERTIVFTRNSVNNLPTCFVVGGDSLNVKRKNAKRCEIPGVEYESLWGRTYFSNSVQRTFELSHRCVCFTHVGIELQNRQNMMHRLFILVKTIKP